MWWFIGVGAWILVVLLIIAFFMGANRQKEHEFPE